MLELFACQVGMHRSALSAVLSGLASLVEVAITVRELAPNISSVWVALLRRDKVCVFVVQDKLD